jgi:hypothetical protein
MVMTAMAQDFWEEQADEPEIRVDGRVDPDREDAYWQSVYFGEAYYRKECSYDDYAPAYCCGYIGYAQYGGCFDDAEKSLCANWLRIKGDSRLTLDEAMQAIRAAWEHAAQGSMSIDEEDEALVDANVLAAQGRTARQPAYATA